MYFLPYSGGKFIANCLALSRHVLCNNKNFALKDLQHTVFDQAYYDFKLKSVELSLPTDITKWKEFGKLPDDFNRCDRTICHIAHFDKDQKEYQQKYNDLITVRLINFNRFNSHCFRLKSPTNDLNRHQSGIEEWLRNSQGDIDLDIDQIMYHPESFVSMMQTLYNTLSLDDFDPKRLNIFYQKYRNLHNLT